MNKNSINIDEVLSRRIDAPEAPSLEQAIIAQTYRPQRDSKSSLTWFQRVYAHQATPMLVSALFIALGLGLYIPEGTNQDLDPNVSVEEAMTIQTIATESAELAELELQEIWMLQDELVLL
ncbi:MAG: hypothetical protein P8I38_15600 [Arenicella sp.]|jgi:hypothetical protein|nr:hypothetical protein [Arenicella sp.]